MSQSAAAVNIKEQDFSTFRTTIQPYFEQIIQDNPPPAGEVIDREKAIRDMYDLVHGRYEVEWVGSPAAGEGAAAAAVQGVGFSECNQMELTVICDVIAVVFQCVGVNGKVVEEAATEIAGEITETQLNGLQTLLQAVKDAQGKQATAMAVFKLLAAVWKLTGIRQFLGALETHMAWYNWVIMGTVISAQLVALFATDGASFVAELVLMSTFFVQLEIDLDHMATACGWD